MNLARIRERLENGFRPFVLELSRGKRIPVRHPDFVAVGNGVVVVLGADDSVTTMDALHIAALYDLPVKHRKRS